MWEFHCSIPSPSSLPTLVVMTSRRSCYNSLVKICFNFVRNLLFIVMESRLYNKTKKASQKAFDFDLQNVFSFYSRMLFLILICFIVIVMTMNCQAERWVFKWWHLLRFYMRKTHPNVDSYKVWKVRAGEIEIPHECILRNIKWKDILVVIIGR